jgi:methyltransferase-like protein
MEEVNTPLYFSQFVERAARRGLQYLSEAELSDVMPHRFPQPVVNAIGAVSGNVIEMEQYLDFLRNVAFRQNLLCHDDITVDRAFSPERLIGLHVASHAKPVSGAPDLQSAAVERFQSSDGTSLDTEHPASKAALLHLSRVWPRTVPCAELLSSAYALLDTESGREDPAQDAYVLNSNLLRAYSYSSELVALHAYAPRVASGIAEYPVATPVARWQARAGVAVTNQYHEVVDLDPVSRLVLPLLDGSRDRAGLREELSALVSQGTLGMQDNGGTTGDIRSVEDVLDGEIVRILAFAADSALLIPS